MINHLPDFLIHQFIEFGVLTLEEGSIQNIDVATLFGDGITIEILDAKATLKIDVVDIVYKGSTLTLTIKDTLVEEPTWFDTTQVTIKFDSTLGDGALACPT